MLTRPVISCLPTPLAPSLWAPDRGRREHRGPAGALVGAAAWALAFGVALATAQAAPPQEPEPTRHPPRLIARLGDPELTEGAEQALVGLGSSVVESVVACVRDAKDPGGADRPRVLAALRVLGELGPDGVWAADFLGHYARTAPPALRLFAVRARADLAPYSRDKGWPETQRRISRAPAAQRKAWYVEHLRHAARFFARTDLDLDGLVAALEKNKLFEREVMAEQLGRLGPEALPALDALASGLRRDTPLPEGGPVQRNGLFVPVEDEYRLRASVAMLAIAPDDPRSALAHGCVAARHPHRSVRLRSLAALAALGPRAREAVPELVLAAQSPDDDVVVEALKVLGMFGSAGLPALAVAEELARSRDGKVATRAGALAAQLRAIRGPGERTPKERARAIIRRQVQALAVEVTAAAMAQAERDNALAALQALGAEAVQILAEDLRRAGEPRERACAVLARMGETATPAIDTVLACMGELVGDTPTEMVVLLGELGSFLGEERRRELGLIVLQLRSENWRCGELTTFLSGVITPDQLRAHGCLEIGAAPSWPALVGHLTSAHAHVRLEAARVCAERADTCPAEWAGKVAGALDDALRHKHPTSLEIELGRGLRTTRTVQLAPQIRAEAGAALLSPAFDDAGRSAGRAACLRDEHPRVRLASVRALARRSDATAFVAPLIEAVGDRRAEIALLAIETLGRLGPAAAAAEPALAKRAAASNRVLAEASKKALRAIAGSRR